MSNFSTLSATYVKPSYCDYLLAKVASFPSWNEAVRTSNGYGSEAMNVEEYREYALFIDEEAADSMLRSRARTAFVWFLFEVKNYLSWAFSLSYKEFCAIHRAIYADEPY